MARVGQGAARDLQGEVSAWRMETACGPLFTEPVSPLMDAASRSLFASSSWKHESNLFGEHVHSSVKHSARAAAAEPRRAESGAHPRLSPETEHRPEDCTPGQAWEDSLGSVTFKADTLPGLKELSRKQDKTGLHQKPEGEIRTHLLPLLTPLIFCSSTSGIL